MYKRIYSNNFRKNLKSYLKNGNFSREKLEGIIDRIILGLPLEVSLKNHKLQGRYKHLYECHIQPDILLIHGKDEKLGLIILINIGSHSNLFG